MDTEYREIDGWPGYRVGNDGTVWSRRRKNDVKSDEWRLLKPKVGDHGYLWVTLQVNGKKWMVKIGRLVLEAFVGPRPDGLLVRHLNDVSWDNRLENLAYVTVVENADDAKRNGKLCEGERHGRAKYTAEQVNSVRRLRAKGMTYAAIAKATGVKRPSVIQIASGRQWNSINEGEDAKEDLH